MVTGLKALLTFGDMETCNKCELAKLTKSHLAPLTEPQYKQCLQQINSDLSVKFSTPSLSSFSYSIIFIDDYSLTVTTTSLKKSQMQQLSYNGTFSTWKINWIKQLNGFEVTTVSSTSLMTFKYFLPLKA